MGYLHSSDFINLKNSLNDYERTFTKLTEYIWQRGYQDYGLEGEMREYAHTLENEHTQSVDRSDILMLRRHEKDFIIRKEEKYVLRFEYQVELIKYKLLLNDSVSESEREEVEGIIDQYKNVFDQLVRTEKLIGLKESIGLKSTVDENATLFLEEVNEIKAKVAEAQEAMLARLKVYYIIGFLIFILLCVWGSIKISKGMTNRIKALTQNLNNFVESNFKEPTENLEDLGRDEVESLQGTSKY